MKPSAARKIDRYARAHGLSFYEACSVMGKRGAAKRRAKARRKTEAEINEERFQKIKAAMPQLY